MRIFTAILGALLGLAFIAAGAMYFLKLGPKPDFPSGSAAAHFFSAMSSTQYLTVIKGLEILGGLLLAIPATRRAGLLIIGPIVVNILLFHACILAGAGLTDPPLLVIVGLTLLLALCEWRAFAAFLRGPAAASAPKSPAKAAKG